MSSRAAAAIMRAREAGVRLEPRPGGRLRMEADQEPSSELLAELRELKAEVLSLLLSGSAPAGSMGGIGGIAGNTDSPRPPMPPMPPMQPHPAVARATEGWCFRSPSWGDALDRPRPGDRCGCCSRGSSGGRWWSLREQPSGWCCWRCHPGDHVPEESRVMVET